jgi:hypothetical protein
VAKEVLWGHHNQRLPEVPVYLENRGKIFECTIRCFEGGRRKFAKTIHLATQNMEVICRSCNIHNLPIALLDLLPKCGIHLGYNIRVVITHLQYSS